MSGTGSYRVGMIAPGETIVWTVQAPSGVDLTTVSTIVLAVRASVAGQSADVTLSPWLLSNVVAGSLKATFLPVGTEFTASGPVIFHATLTLDGVLYRLLVEDDYVRKAP